MNSLLLLFALSASDARVYINAGYRAPYHMTRGSESENGLFAATVTTGAVAAVAAASFGFYTHEAVARLLLRSGDNNAVNARVEDKLSKMERSMQQQHQKDTSMLQDMSFALNQTSTRLEHLDRALARSRLLAATSTGTATQQRRRRR
jgi:hypothetical protein